MKTSVRAMSRLRHLDILQNHRPASSALEDEDEDEDEEEDEDEDEEENEDANKWFGAEETVKHARPTSSSPPRHAFHPQHK